MEAQIITGLGLAFILVGFLIIDIRVLMKLWKDGAHEVFFVPYLNIFLKGSNEFWYVLFGSLVAWGYILS